MAHSTASTNPLRSQFESRHRYLDQFTCGLVAVSPLALGGTHPVAAVALCIAFLLSCAVSLQLHFKAQLSPRHYWPIYAVAALSVWVLFRSTTFGAFTNPPLADAAWSLWPELNARGGIAPGRAALWSVRTLTFCLAAWYAAQRFFRSDRIAWPLVSIIAGGALVALVGVFQLLTRSQELLWFYAPLDWARVVPLAGPFVNPNQAGSYVGLAAILALIAARGSRALHRRIIFALIALPFAGYLVLVDARGALVALIAAAVTFFISSLVEDGPAKRRIAVQLAVPITMVTSAAVLLYALASSRALFDDGTLVNKVSIWRHSLEVPLAAPLFGFGPRGFQDAYAALGLNQNHVWIEDPESGPLQLFAEHGIPVGLLVCGVVVWLLVRTHRIARGNGIPIATGLSAVWAYLLVEAVTGMGLHASGYLVAVGLCFGVMSGRAIRVDRPEPTTKSFVGVGVMLSAALLALVVSPASVRVSLEDSRVPLWSELHEVPITDPMLLERGLAMAKKTPARAALIQQMALIFSAQQQHDHAMSLARGLRTFAPNYRSPQRAAIHVALNANELDVACEWLQAHAEQFGELPAEETTAWTEQAGPEQRCFETHELQLLASNAYFEQKRDELGYSILFQLAAEEDASTKTLVRAVRASTRMKAPELGALWVETLRTRDDIRIEDYDELLRWAAQHEDRATHVHLLAEAASAAYPKHAEFRIIYVENFLAHLPEGHNGAWYAELKPVIDSCRVLARGDRAASRRVILIGADAAWLADRWDEAEALYKRLPVADLNKNDAVTTLFRLGEIARGRNDLYQAQRYYRDALEKNPRFQPAILALQEIGG